MIGCPDTPIKQRDVSRAGLITLCVTFGLFAAAAGLLLFGLN